MQKAKHKVIFHLVIGALLMLIYPWESLFSGNQNVYFLWAAAKSGFGHLTADPLLNQTDPYPAFTLLAGLIFKALPVSFFQVVYWLLNSVYSFSLFGITDRFTGIYSGIRSIVLFTVLFLVFHSTQLWGTFFETATGADLRWIWDSGLAEQGLLRGYLQPSVLGVFLLLGVYHLIQENHWKAAIAFGIAGAFHANYLALELIALGLFASYSLVKRSLTFDLIKPMLLWLIMTLPYLYYVVTHFLGGSSEGVQNEVLNHFSDHIHFDPTTWLNAKTAIQLIAFGIFLSMFRKQAFGKWFIVITGVTILLSVLAFTIPGTPLLSLTPWRVSVVLFPIAFSILIGLISQSLRPGRYVQLAILPFSALLVSLIYFRIMGSGNPEFMLTWRLITAVFILMAFVVGWFSRKMERPFQIQLNNTAALGLVFLLIFSGILGKWTEFRTRSNFPWENVRAFVQTNAKDGELYMVPPEMLGFRMNAGVAVFSDQLLVHGATLSDQYQRQSITKEFYSTGVLKSEAAVSHAIVPNGSFDNLGTSIYSDEHYTVIKLD
ncbi:MAG: hypothetical protein ACI9FU_000632 [Granulosicoccus sp.]|jgi:hypothetical protein